MENWLSCVCHLFADLAVRKKKHGGSRSCDGGAENILAGSMVQYLAGTKMRAQPGAPNLKSCTFSIWNGEDSLLSSTYSHDPSRKKKATMIVSMMDRVRGSVEYLAMLAV